MFQFLNEQWRRIKLLNRGPNFQLGDVVDVDYGAKGEAILSIRLKKGTRYGLGDYYYEYLLHNKWVAERDLTKVPLLNEEI